jgi:hypothetical protein
MYEFTPRPLPGQPHDDVLYVNTAASPLHLYESAARRLTAVEDLLSLLEHIPDCGLVDEVARLASALSPSISEARHLIELALAQRDSLQGRPA